MLILKVQIEGDLMDLEKMRRLTQNMENVNEGSTSGISPEFAEQLYDAGVENQEAGHHRKAFEMFKKSAEAGNSFAMKKLGDIYSEGNGVNVNKNPHEAFKWYKKAAELGNVEAMWEVVTAYEEGNGVKSDKTQVFAWVKKLAETGEVGAMCWLGELYNSGEGVVQNYSEAFKWTQKSANQGFILAMYDLAFMYIDKFKEKNGFKNNIDNAIHWMTEVAENGTDKINVDAMYTLGLLYQDKFDSLRYDDIGKLVSTSEMINKGAFHCDEMSKKWLKKAADLGHPKAGGKLYEKEHETDVCFITTAVCGSFGKADDCYELTAFRNFRDNWLMNQSDGKNLISEYYEVAPKIVEKINSLADSAEVYKNIWRDYLATCLKFIEVGENSKCKKIYVEMVETLKEKFLK